MSLRKKNYLLNPFGEAAFMNNVIFESPYGVLRDLFAQKDIDLQTYDKGNLATADMVLSFNYSQSFYDLCQAAGVPKERLMLFLFEPNVVIPEQHDPAIWEKFGTVFSMHDDLIATYGFKKIVCPQGESYMNPLPGYEGRKFLTLINANRFSYEPNELYTLRREAIRYFEKYPDFDLYGYWWNRKITVLSPRNLKGAWRNRALLPFLNNVLDAIPTYSSYRGSVKDKYGTMASYKFAICFENESKAPGYITEKIFDCFFAGTVPIYYGAPNIQEYIPKEAFIDLRDYKDFSELAAYLETIDKTAFLKLQEAGQRYIHSKQFTDTWLPKAVFAKIVADCT